MTEMNKETRAKLRKSIEDIFGLPFHYSNSVELTQLNEHVEGSMDDIMDAFIEEACGNCEYSCNEVGCDKRHNT